jgi:hypothetical protein
METSGVFFYIEMFDARAGIVLIDFVDSNDFFAFSSLANLNYAWEAKGTMIELSGYNQKKVKEGASYEISEETIRLISQTFVTTEDSAVVGFKYVMNQDSPIIFGSSKSFDSFNRFSQFVGSTNRELFEGAGIQIGRVKKLLIRNIGQGNWNEVWDKDKPLIVFDIGTIWSTSKSDLANLIGDREKIYQAARPILVLSHWDVDHYHFLTELSDETIKSFQGFVFRSGPPNLTARKVYSRFSMLNRQSLVEIAPADPSPKRSSKVLYPIRFSGSGNIILYNASRNASRNHSGIGLLISEREIIAVLSGDFEYKQISDSIISNIDKRCVHHLIVPHHGGNAGKFIYNFRPKNSLGEAVVSVGKNPYKPKHPHEKNLDSLRNIGFHVVRTDYLGTDYEINF